MTIGDGAIGICAACLKTVIAINNFQRNCAKIDAYLKTTYKGIHFNASAVSASIHMDLAPFVDVGDENDYTKSFLFDDIDGLSGS